MVSPHRSKGARNASGSTVIRRPLPAPDSQRMAQNKKPQPDTVAEVDPDVAQLLGVGGNAEYPLALAVLQGANDRPDVGSTQGPPTLDAIGLASEPIARAPVTFPLVNAAQHDGDLADVHDPLAARRCRGRARLLRGRHA